MPSQMATVPVPRDTEEGEPYGSPSAPPLSPRCEIPPNLPRRVSDFKMAEVSFVKGFPFLLPPKNPEGDTLHSLGSEKSKVKKHKQPTYITDGHPSTY